MRVRSIVLFLSLLVLFLIPVSASDVDNSAAWVNVLDYATLNDSGSNYIRFNNSVTVRYDTGIQTLVHFVDIVVNSSGADITSASINGNSLTVIALDSQVFRIYGAISYITSGFYDLTFNSSGDTHVDIMQFHVSGQWRLMYDEIGTLSVGSNSYTMTSSVSAVKHTFSGDNFSTFTANVYCSNWKKYDFVDFYVTCFAEGLDSIAARFNGLDVPIDVSYLGGSTGTSAAESNNKIMIRMDVRGLDRTIVNYPFIELAGVAGPNNNNMIVLVKVTGSVVADSVDPFLHYFRIYADSQFSYYDSIISAQQQMYTLVSSGLRSLSADITAASSFVAKEILDLRTSLITKISSFQTSMETYLHALPRRIAEEISKVFKPSEGKFEAAKEESQELAEDKLGAVYQSAVVIDQIAGAFTNQTPQTTIAIPLVSVEVLPGVPFAFGGWDVPVVPSGLEFFVETLKFVIDIVCTLAFLNGMKRRLDGFLGGESGAD